MTEIINFIHYIYGNGYAGIIIVLLAAVIYLLRKIATNHLHHLDMKLDTMQAAIALVAKDVKEIKADCGPCKERIAKVEGKLE